MKLLIIDGNHLMHRAFHAYPTLTDSQEQPIGAVYGFFSLLLRVIQLTQITHLVICFDRPSPTFRKNMFANYQIKRAKMDDGLATQMVTIHEALNEIGVPIFELDGYEADDLMGTLAYQAAKENIETIIFSGDRDLLQLINERVKILAPVTGVTQFILFDEEKVKEKFGITPIQIIDYKALIGDGSDGYPGVNGIGPKTAVNLINQYPTVEDIFKNLKNIPEKISLKLANGAEIAVLCKKLATILLDVPVHLEIEKADIKNFTKEQFLAVFDKYNFNSLKNRLGYFKKDLEKTNKKTKNENQMSLI